MAETSKIGRVVADRRTLLKAALALPFAAIGWSNVAGATGIPKGTVIKLRLNAKTNGFKVDGSHGAEWVNVYGVEHDGKTITGEVQIQLEWSGSRSKPPHGIRLDSDGNGESREYTHGTGSRIIGASVWCR